MTFNALLLGTSFLHFGTLLIFYINTPWLLKAILFNYTSGHVRKDLKRKKVRR